MKITIKAISEPKDINIELSNNSLNNQNFIELYVDGKEYIVPIEELYQAVTSFIELRDKCQ